MTREKRKICPVCGAVIVNGVNGAGMYKECFRCRPIVYYAKPKKGTCYTREEADALEDRCINE